MGRKLRIMEKILPLEGRVLLKVANSRKAQGSLEYIMMVAAASIIIVLALVMVVKLKSSIPVNVSVNGTSTSISNAITQQLGKLGSGTV